MGKQAASRFVFNCKLRETFRKRLEDSLKERYSQMSKTVLVPKKGYAVLIPLLEVDGEPSILFTQRSKLLANHRSEICFPGGLIEDGEEIEQAALRECSEEIGLNKDDVEIWGILDSITLSDTSKNISPVVGVISNYDINKLEAHWNEVQTIFTTPIAELCTNNGYTHFRRRGYIYRLPVFNISRLRVIASNSPPQREYRIWGLTATILHFALSKLFPNLYKSQIATSLPCLFSFSHGVF